MNNVIDRSRYVPALLTAISTKYRASQSATFKAKFALGVLEWRILLVLASEPQSSGRKIAAIVGFDTAAISRSVAHLSQLDLVKVERDRGHVRRQLLSLTPAGWEIYHKMAEIALERERALLSCLSAAEREMLVSILQRVVENMPEVNGWLPESGMSVRE